MGVDMNQTIALTFLLGGVLAGAAGVVWGLRFGYVRQDLGFNAGLKAFTAAVLGGIGNITGAVLGGFVIGFIENFASSLGLSRWSEFLGVHGPDVRPDLPADGHPRPAAGRPGMTRRCRDPARDDRRRAGVRSSRTPSPTHHRSVDDHGRDGRSSTILLMLSCPQVPAAVARSSRPSPWYDAFANAGVFVLLAMGLNVVIGMAGLLDLGYAAFFAIGAYTYAYSNSPFSRPRPAVPARCSSSARRVAAVFGIRSARRPCGCAATTSRS